MTFLGNVVNLPPTPIEHVIHPLALVDTLLLWVEEGTPSAYPITPPLTLVGAPIWVGELPRTIPLTVLHRALIPTTIHVY
jgi:hypothetical protein